MAFARPKKPPSKKTVAATGGIAAMIAIATPFYTMWEGRELVAYLDSVNVLTICSGDTRNVKPGQVATEAECDERTNAILNEFGEGVAKMSPGIEDSVYEWGAHTTFAANIGLGAYGKSSVRRLFNEGRRVEACRFMRRYKYAGGRVLAGLQYRREGEGSRIGESELCLAGAVPAELRG